MLRRHPCPPRPLLCKKHVALMPPHHHSLARNTSPSMLPTTTPLQETRRHPCPPTTTPLQETRRPQCSPRPFPCKKHQRSLACLWPSRSCTVNYPPQGSSQYPRLWSFLVRLQPLGEFRVVAPGGQAGGDFQQLPLPFGVRSLVVTRPRCVRLRCHETRAPQAGVPNSWAKPECASPPCGVPPMYSFFLSVKGETMANFLQHFLRFLHVEELRGNTVWIPL